MAAELLVAFGKQASILSQTVFAPAPHKRPATFAPRALRNYLLDIPDMEAILPSAMESKGAVERRAEERSGQKYLLIQPFKKLDDRIDGVVTLLLDSAAEASEA